MTRSKFSLWLDAVVVQRGFVEMAGGLEPGALLSEIFCRGGGRNGKAEWVSQTRKGWERITLLTPARQTAAIVSLMDKELIEEKLDGEYICLRIHGPNFERALQATDGGHL